MDIDALRIEIPLRRVEVTAVTDPQELVVEGKLSEPSALTDGPVRVRVPELRL